MTIDEAISVLAAKKKDDVERGARMSAEACQLGIEALKGIKKTRAGLGIICITDLPGETT